MMYIRALASLAALLAAPLHAQTISGPATAVDGKTLEMTGTVIVLAHIDAPETKQSCQRDGVVWACGAEAAQNLAAIIGRDTVTCTIIGVDADGVPLATCETEILNVGREMVRRGMALALDGAPEEFDTARGIAQQLKFGLWGSEFQLPAEWRSANPDAVKRVALMESMQPAERRAPGRALSERRYTNALGCAIKGNRSIRGDWIYHLPGQVYYERTRPEDLFCTERAAQSAGYRRSKE